MRSESLIRAQRKYDQRRKPAISFRLDEKHWKLLERIAKDQSPSLVCKQFVEFMLKRS